MEDTPENRNKFATIMWGVAEDFGGTLSKEGLKIRFNALQEYSIDQISKAGTWLLKNREKTFPAVPTTKEIIEVIDGHQSPKLGSRSQADIEVDKVLEKLKYHGRAGKADFEDSITQYLMTVRWPYESWASYIKTEDIKWWRKEFVEAYQAHSERVKAEGMLIEGFKNGGVVDLKRLANGATKTIGG